MIVHIDASWENRLWTVRDPVRRISVARQRLATAQRALAERLGRQLQIDVGQIQFEVVFSKDHPALLAWSEAEELRARAHGFLQASARKRLEAINRLMSDGLTAPEIGELLSMSHQRIQSIVHDARAEPSTPDTQ
ncbi:hypothetical protein [Arthrobacter bambusae]|uniref:hypothetical protein n=1 Tax=Arthrobacter bambusae TaxID=1338426 RepID=UPI00277EB335|nr:hypothetical protein [Arthrobacter bambusae]MDQ0212482.1 DNA-binding CsgD family transcriptional regulator [Arthrobacter bambusae]MDQ0236930.1 DNA-binding CsgD family transcriptional regulator [Arthrobacter bambusae]